MVRTIKTVTVITLFLWGSIAFGVSISAQCKEAARAYRARNFEKAYALYDAIEHKGPGVWYNMGNCLYEMHDYSQAIIAFKRAQRGASYDLLHSIEHAIKKAANKVGITFDESWSVLFFEWCSYTFSPLLLQILFLLCWYLLWILLLFKRKLRFYVVYLFLICCALFFFGSVLVVQYSSYLYQRGFVAKQAALLAGPHEQFDVIYEIPHMHMVQIRESRDGWYKIASGNHIGWVAAQNIELV